MTKNFRNQRRDGIHPSSRYAASGPNRDEHTTQPAHPRLSREAVDRAWENGATHTHADYHPRQQPPFSSAQRQGRPAPASSFQRSRQPQNYQNYRPAEAPQNRYDARSSAPRSYGYQQPRQPGNDRPDHFNRTGYRAPDNRSGLNSERWTRRPAPPQREEYAQRFENNRFSDRASDYRDSRRPPRFSQNTPGYHDTHRPARFSQDAPDYRERDARQRQPRSFRQEEQDREQFARGRRTGTPAPRRDYDNPRWQSRPYAQRSNPAPRRDYTHEQPGRAQFEGDYEHFSDSAYEEAPYPAKHTPRPEPTYERPTTRLPSGRVLKGPRPAQRKQARFWNEVEGESDKLVSAVSPVQNQNAGAEDFQEKDGLQDRHEEPAIQKKFKRSQRPQQPGGNRVKTVKTARAADARPYSAKVARKNAHGQQHQVTRPSQRGYRWPAANE